MTDPMDPQYLPQSAQPEVPPPSAPPRPGFLQRVGERARRRPLPRQGVALAGVGVGLVLVGILVWAGDYLASGGDGDGTGDSRQWLGVVLSLLAVVVGYVLVTTQRRGPLGAAGVAASAIGVPVTLGFLTFGPDDAGLPFSLDAVVLVSVGVWLISYFGVPGARGHGLYLGLAAVLMWAYVLQKAEPDAILPTSLLFDEGFGPDWTTVATLSLLFGLAYYGAALLLDRSGYNGVAVPLVVAGLLATVNGMVAAAAELEEIPTGVLLIVVGLALGRYGALAGRRFTTWGWSAGVAIGVGLIIAKVAEENAAGAGIALIVCGAIVVALGHFVAFALHEPDDVATDAVAGPEIGAQPVS